LLTQFEQPSDVFDNPSIVQKISDRTRSALYKPDWDGVEKELEWFNQSESRHIITLHDSVYPELLKQISDPPSILFVEGDVELLKQWQLAIVGSRNPSASGRDSAYEFSRYLVQGDIIITSGLASGIDAAAHKGALASEGRTIAVTGTGLDTIYPSKHHSLAEQIKEQGAIVTEYPLGTVPRAENFPRRNRIISGLSLGALVVEAAIKSGSLITARMAMEQGREVFAIPGSIHNPLARGCHKLIREGAKLVETADDIIEELAALANVNVSETVKSEVQQDLVSNQNDDEDYDQLFEFLGFDPISIDKLVAKSELTADAVSSMLLLLELQGRVESLPGGRYIRTGN
jgi:DNA processing protein